MIGHEKNKKFFKNAVKNGRLVHAYLFSGPEMIGKKMFALELAETLCCDIEHRQNPDIKVICPKAEEGETKIYIEDIRDLKAFLSVKSFYGGYKVAVIDDADRLTPEASNSILKILEEPSASSILILIDSKPGFLLPTIYSRCQEITFQPLEESELSGLIPPKLKPEDGELLKMLAYNRPGWIIKNIDKLSEIKRSIQDFDKILGQGTFEKMQYAAKLYSEESYPELVSNLIYRYYFQNPKNPKLLSGLIRLSKVISQPQYNHRLALENFLINS